MSTINVNTIQDASAANPTDVGILGKTYKAFPWAIYGNTYANNAVDAVNDIDIAIGGCMDDTNTVWMPGTALTKQLDVAWAVGSAAGGLDTGAIANADYYIWRIMRTDLTVVDALYSLSSTAPTMPAGYTYKRKIGWIRRAGATIVACHTYETEGGGIEMTWDAPTLDVNLAATLTTSRRTDAIKVPLNFSVTAVIIASIVDATANSVARVESPDQTLGGVSVATSASPNIIQTTTAGCSTQLRIRTSAAGLVAAIGSNATIDTYTVVTLGFNWARRN